MSYRWVEHTSELELEIDALSEAAAFTDAALALAELLGEGGAGPPVERELALSAPDRGALLVQWLDELVFAAETDDLVPEAVTRLELSEHGLVATVRCRRGSPPHVVKGATYHRLAFARSPHGYRATVVLDV